MKLLIPLLLLPLALAACPPPIIDTPINGDTIDALGSLLIRGRIQGGPTCNVVRYFAFGPNIAQPVQRTATAFPFGKDLYFEISTSFVDVQGNYRIDAIASDSYSASEQDSTEVSVAFTYTPAQTACDPPVILMPVDNSFATSLRPTIMGTQSNPAACPQVRLTELYFSTDQLVPVDANGEWSFTPPQDLAVYLYMVAAYAVRPDGTDGSRESYVMFAVRCPQPDIVLESTFVTDNTLQIVGQGDTTDPNCRAVSFIDTVSRRTLGTANGSAGNIFSLTLADLAPGQYSVIMSLGSDTTSSASTPFDFVIAPQPSVSRSMYRTDVRPARFASGRCAVPRRPHAPSRRRTEGRSTSASRICTRT
jgi:hypothetical protein